MFLILRSMLAASLVKRHGFAGENKASKGVPLTAAVDIMFGIWQSMRRRLRGFNAQTACGAGRCRKVAAHFSVEWCVEGLCAAASPCSSFWVAGALYIMCLLQLHCANPAGEFGAVVSGMVKLSWFWNSEDVGSLGGDRE